MAAFHSSYYFRNFNVELMTRRQLLMNGEKKEVDRGIELG
jgi:hypothetical protein